MWKLRRKGKQLTKYIDGIFYLTDFHRLLQLALQDACLHDTAYLQPRKEGNKIFVDRIFDDEILVDPRDGHYGTPRSMYKQRILPRESLLKKYEDDEEKRRKILKAKTPTVLTSATSADSVADMILAYEAWHLPSSEGAGDGKHIICLETGGLEWGEWKKDHFPPVPLRWTAQPQGYQGKPLVDDIVGIQYEVNELLLTIQECMAKNVPRIGLETGSQITETMINDTPFHFVEFTKVPPIPLIWPSVPADVLQQVEKYIRYAFDLTGISMLAASAQKPAGLESAAALREIGDVQSERFILQSQAYDTTAVEVALRCIELAKEVATEHGNFKVKVPFDNNFIETIDWNAVDMDKDAYMMRPFPTAFLPHTPSGRLATITEMIDKQMISREEGMMLLDYPDLESVTSLVNSSIHHIDMLIEQMLEDNKYTAPSPFTNLGLAARRVSESVLKAELDGYPEERIQHLRKYTTEVQAIIQKQQEALQQQAMMAQMAQAPGMQAPGMEGVPPTMMPNATPPGV
jgi:hypothetical protein